MKMYHTHPLSVHMSRDRLYALLRKQYYWKGMLGDICKWVQSCSKCNSVKANQPINNGFLQPIVTTRSFEIVAEDIMGPLTISPEGYRYLLNFIDLYTSWPESIPLFKGLKSRRINICFSTRHHHKTLLPSGNPNRSRH
jgi:hypothetical protein